MGLFEASFEIEEEKDCPMYCRGERFRLSGLAFMPPKGKPTCLFLAREVTEYMIKKMGEEHFSTSMKRRNFFNCSGCTGLIKVAIKQRDDHQYATSHMKMLADFEKKSRPAECESLASQLSSLSLFEVIDEQTLMGLISNLQVREFEPDAYVIRKGVESSFLYMILTGKVNVEIDENIIACLGRGEMFGEMSMLTGKPAGASIKVVEPSKIISISNEQFRHILIKYPSIQMSVTKILAQRVSSANRMMGLTPGSSLNGQLSEVPVAELCQLINSNVKSGVVNFDLNGAIAKLAFLKGEMVKASFDDLTGEQAFFALLKEKDGCFDFTAGLPEGFEKLSPIGGFMGLLMEGLQKIDEDKEQEGQE